MKKALLHILFLSLLLTTAGAHAFVSPDTTVAYAVKEKAAKEIVSTTIAGSDLLLQKNDLLIDVDDYDEYDDSHDYAKAKPVNTLPVFAAARLLLTQVTAPTSLAGNYTYTHFSRLPRHSFISLRVLRI